MKNKFKVALVSLKNIEADIDFNLARHRMWFERCLEEKPDFIGFPEFSLTGWVKDPSDAVPLKADIVMEIHRWAAKEKVFVAFGVVERRAEKRFNTCVVAGPEGRVGVMRKINLVGSESDDYTSGTEFPVLDVGGCRMGVAICADATYFEMFRLLSRRGAEVIFAPHANSLGNYGNSPAGWAKWRLERWPLFARETCVCVAGINNAGRFETPVPGEEATKYCGGGLVMDWTGAVLAKVSLRTKKETMLVGEIDLKGLRKARKAHFDGSVLRPGIVYNRPPEWFSPPE